MANLPNPRCTMTFTLGKTTWSESHVYASNTAVTDLTLQAAALNLITARVQCLGSNVQVNQVRVSQEQINRDVWYLPRPSIPMPTATGYSGGPFYPGSATYTFQSPHLSWPIKFTDNNQNSIAITYIAGMPALAAQNGPGPFDVTAGASFTAGYFLAKYATYLTMNSPWGAASRTWPAGAFTAATGIAMLGFPSITLRTASQPTLIAFNVPTPTPPASLIPGQFIRVGGLKYNTAQNRLRLNGTYQILQISTATAPATGLILTCAIPRLNGPVLFTSFGYYQAATYTFAAYNGYTLDNMTHRKRGGSEFSPRGRRS